MERKDLQREYDKLKARYDELMRGRVVPNARASRIGHEMQRIKDQLDAIDRRDAEQWAIRKAPIDDMLEVIAIPLLADVMNDIVAGVDGSLRCAAPDARKLCSAHTPVRYSVRRWLWLTHSTMPTKDCLTCWPLTIHSSTPSARN